MNQLVFGRRYAITLAIAALAVLLGLPTSADAGRPPTTVPDNGYGPNNRPVFFVVSLTDTFDTPVIDKVTGGVINRADEMGSQLMVVPVGEYIAGNDIGETRYDGGGLSSIDLSNIPDPETGLPMDPEQLNQNQVTVLGSFCTFTGDVHMVTPDPSPIPAAVQEAFFRASAIFDQLPMFPTTVEFACFIHENQGEAGADINDIMEAITTSPMTLSCTTCYAEGDLFPHDPTEETLFTFDVRFDTGTGDFELNICLPITVWIKGQDGTNPFNLGSHGVLPVVIPTTEFFDAVDEVDVETLELGTFVVDSAGIEVFVGVPIVKCSILDQDGDGDMDLVVHFSTDAIVGLDDVDDTTTELRFSGATYLGMCIEGVDRIRVVPPAN
jgi:hypothetical protein